MHIALVDDDAMRRSHMVDELTARGIDVTLVADHDTAAGWPTATLRSVDRAVVDIYDDAAPLEWGTDLFSGIKAVIAFRNAGVPTIAITPHRHHPLVEQRIHESKPIALYRRWELNDGDALATAAMASPKDRATQAVRWEVLHRFGAAAARTNAAVDAYERSKLVRLLRAEATLRNLGASKRQAQKLVAAVNATGFTPPPTAERDPGRLEARWPEVRDYLLILMGRLDAPSTEFDGHEDLWW